MWSVAWPKCWNSKATYHVHAWRVITGPDVISWGCRHGHGRAPAVDLPWESALGLRWPWGIFRITQSFSGSLWLNPEILRILAATAGGRLDTPRGPPCPSEPAQEIRPDWPDPTAPHNKEELVSTLKGYVTVLSNLSLFRKAKLDTKSKIMDMASWSTWESYMNGPGLQ